MSIYSGLNSNLRRLIEDEELEYDKSEKEDAQESALDYVDPDYQNVSDDVLDDVKECVNDGFTDLCDEIEKKFELTHNEAVDLVQSVSNNPDDYMDEIENDRYESEPDNEIDVEEDSIKYMDDSGDDVLFLTQGFEMNPDDVELLHEKVYKMYRENI